MEKKHGGKGQRAKGGGTVNYKPLTSKTGGV
jgi:hypothetical protein